MRSPLEPADGHRDREGRIAHHGDASTLRAKVKHRAPVEHRTLGEEENEAQAADDQNPAARQHEQRRALAFAAIGQQSAAEGEEQARMIADDEARDQRRRAAPEERADPARARKDAADAEEAVETPTSSLFGSPSRRSRPGC